jgi:hypothetical protein
VILRGRVKKAGKWQERCINDESQGFPPDKYHFQMANETLQMANGVQGTPNKFHIQMANGTLQMADGQMAKWSTAVSKTFVIFPRTRKYPTFNFGDDCLAFSMKWETHFLTMKCPGHSDCMKSNCSFMKDGCLGFIASSVFA